MNVTFRQLRLFHALAEQRSISAVARHCHVTQPTVSMQLRELAETVGMPLHEVVGRRVYLTAAGEELARTTRAMFDEWESFSQRVAKLRGLEGGRLRVAVVSTAKYFVPRLLGEFCSRHADTDVALEVLNRDGVLQRLRDNRDDLYVMSQPPAESEVVSLPFMANPLHVVAALDHPLAERRRVGLSQLSAERFILREVGSGTRLACDTHFKALGFKPAVRLELGSNEAIKQAVAGGLGVTVISQHALGPDPAAQGLAQLAVTHFPIHANWFVVYPRGKRLSPLAQSFLEDLRNESGMAPAGATGRRSLTSRHTRKD